jgi:hypothetical protein
MRFSWVFDGTYWNLNGESLCGLAGDFLGLDGSSTMGNVSYLS